MTFLKIKIPNRDIQSMAQDGDAILRSLQNNSMPIIDLFVRESIQNSLDAYLSPESPVEIQIKHGSFNGISLGKYLEKLEDTAPKSKSEFISITDINTTGLDGAVVGDKEELDKSNFHKLIFNIGKQQTSQHAGGSWGLGKTIYFKLGIGIVIYYTKIHSGEERLLVSLIENQNDESTRLLRESERGIAWWGSDLDKEGNLLPISDPSEIASFLSVFGLTRFEDGQTGTSIIIPYIRSDCSKKTEDYWENSYAEKIEMAVQRWYNPRISNRDYPQINGLPYLIIQINGQRISPIEFAPTFANFRSLYEAASRKIGDDEQGIVVKEVSNFRSITPNMKIPVGYLAYKIVSSKQLEMYAPNNLPSPLKFICSGKTSKSREYGHSIIAYTRKPGMILNYSADINSWLKKDLDLGEDNYMLALFVPNSDQRMHDDYFTSYENIESYLRATELSDHSSWIDLDGYTIVKRIRERVSTILCTSFDSHKKSENNSISMSLARKYGAILLPNTTIKNKSTRKNNGVRTKNNFGKFCIKETKLLVKGLIQVRFELIQKVDEEGILSLEVVTQSGKLDFEKWTNEFGGTIKYPLCIENVIYDEKSEDESTIKDFCEIKENQYSIRFKNLSDKEILLNGDLYIKAMDEKFTFDLSFRAITS